MSLTVKNLTKYYGDKLVVDHLSFDMPKPGVYALLGTNGAGKTTTIRMMLNMLSKNDGEVLWNGAPLSTESCNVGYLAEERGLYPKYTLMDQVLYFAQLRGLSRDDAKKRVRLLSRRLGMDEYLYPTKPARRSMLSARGGIGAPADGRVPTKSGKADQLSKGNQQKIQLMTALLSDPELIILDEPLSGLDPVNTDLFRDIIREEIAAGKYLIMSSHQMATVEEFCTEITILDKSRAVLQGNLNEIKKSYGRVNLRIKVESDISDVILRSGAVIIAEKEHEYEVKVSGEAQANEILRALVNGGTTIIAFDLREPSLHEIFVEKVGHADA